MSVDFSSLNNIFTYIILIAVPFTLSGYNFRVWQDLWQYTSNYPFI